MTAKILFITAFYFLIGALAIIFIQRKLSSDKKKELITKYVFYLLIVHGMLWVCHYHLAFILLSTGIVMAGMAEMLMACRASGRKKPFYAGLAFYLIPALLFMSFAIKGDTASYLRVYVLVFVFDGFSQICGQLMGRHKLLATISPNKTIEGFIGGLVISILTAVYLLNLPVLPGLLIIVASFTGDILASWNKRLRGIKDYSSLIPGHGGVLDRFDSFIAAGALTGFVFMMD